MLCAVDLAVCSESSNQENLKRKRDLEQNNSNAAAEAKTSSKRPANRQKLEDDEIITIKVDGRYETQLSRRILKQIEPDSIFCLDENEVEFNIETIHYPCGSRCNRRSLDLLFKYIRDHHGYYRPSKYKYMNDTETYDLAITSDYLGFNNFTEKLSQEKPWLKLCLLSERKFDHPNDMLSTILNAKSIFKGLRNGDTNWLDHATEQWPSPEILTWFNFSKASEQVTRKLIEQYRGAENIPYLKKLVISSPYMTYLKNDQGKLRYAVWSDVVYKNRVKSIKINGFQNFPFILSLNSYHDLVNHSWQIWFDASKKAALEETEPEYIPYLASVTQRVLRNWVANKLLNKQVVDPHTLYITMYEILKMLAQACFDAEELIESRLSGRFFFSTWGNEDYFSHGSTIFDAANWIFKGGTPLEWTIPTIVDLGNVTGIKEFMLSAGISAAHGVSGDPDFAFVNHLLIEELDGESVARFTYRSMEKAGYFLTIKCLETLLDRGYGFTSNILANYPGHHRQHHDIASWKSYRYKLEHKMPEDVKAFLKPWLDEIQALYTKQLTSNL